MRIHTMIKSGYKGIIWYMFCTWFLIYSYGTQAQLAMRTGTSKVKEDWGNGHGIGWPFFSSPLRCQGHKVPSNRSGMNSSYRNWSWHGGYPSNKIFVLLGAPAKRVYAWNWFPFLYFKFKKNFTKWMVFRHELPAGYSHDVCPLGTLLEWIDTPVPRFQKSFSFLIGQP